MTDDLVNRYKKIARLCRVSISTQRILTFIGALVLILCCYTLTRAWVALRSADKSTLEAVATAAAALVAVAGLLFTLAQQLADKAEERSRFFLEEYQKGYDAAYDVLGSAKPNDPHLRLKWIAAARILESARRVATKVTVNEHRDVIHMDIPRQAQKFQPFLENVAAYYYGAIPSKFVTNSGKEALDEAARRSTDPLNGVLNFHREVPERVLHAVWRAVQYPEGYADVLGDVFDEGQILFLPPGMRDYVEHVRRYHSAMGKLYDQNGVEMPPPEENIHGDVKSF